MTKTGYFVDEPLEMRRLECEYDACDCLVHELLPRMELGALKKPPPVGWVLGQNGIEPLPTVKLHRE